MTQHGRDSNLPAVTSMSIHGTGEHAREIFDAISEHPTTINPETEKQLDELLSVKNPLPEGLTVKLNELLVKMDKAFDDDATQMDQGPGVIDRLSWNDYFMSIAYLCSRRSTCHRRQIGAVAVKDKRIVATGYNGAPPGIPHCTLTSCVRINCNIPSGTQLDTCFSTHAEANLIIQAANIGISLKDATVYTTTFPCIACCKLLIGCQIRKIYYVEGYPDKLSEFMFKLYERSLNRADTNGSELECDFHAAVTILEQMDRPPVCLCL